MAPRETVAIMRPEIIDRGADRDDSVRADRAGLAEDAALHAGDVADIRYARLLVKLAQIIRQVGVFIEPAQVALVADVVARIETHQARKQPPFSLGFDLAAQITLL